MNINLLGELEQIKPAVWETIQPYLPIAGPEQFCKMVADYPYRQGKYFRPALVLWATEMFGGQTEDALLTAAAMQLSEDWLLIHDDFLDQSEERRGLPTLNKLYGNELAVNAGDALHVVMWQVLTDNHKLLGSERCQAIHKLFGHTLLKTIEGQHTDVDWIKSGNLNITEADYLRMIDIKAGLYTIITPLQLGAIIAGRPHADLEKITEWGLYLGRAFQIWDDVMNLSATSHEQGKESGGDILEGKRTLMLIDLLKRCNHGERQEVVSIYAKPRSDKLPEEQKYIMHLMAEYSSIEYAKAAALDYSQLAGEAFDKATADLPSSHAKDILREAISFVVSRNR